MVNPHNLARLKDTEGLLFDTEVPDWVLSSLKRAPFVVVRRAPLKKGEIPVGIRGPERSQRFAAHISEESIAKWITPENITTKQPWKGKNTASHIFNSLDFLYALFHSYNLKWGPTGSVGFELATGIPTIKETSDLDLIIRSPEAFSVESARKVIREFEKMEVRIDAQVESSDGAFSLEEYAGGKQQVLLRTKEGPKLWNALTQRNQSIKTQSFGKKEHRGI